MFFLLFFLSCSWCSSNNGQIWSPLFASCDQLGRNSVWTSQFMFLVSQQTFIAWPLCTSCSFCLFSTNYRPGLFYVFLFSCYVTLCWNGEKTSLCVISRTLKALVASNQGEGDCQPESEETLEILQDVGAPLLTGSNFRVGLFRPALLHKCLVTASKGEQILPRSQQTRLFQLSRGVALRALFLQKRSSPFTAASLSLAGSRGCLPTVTGTQTFIYNCCYSIIELCSYKLYGSSKERLWP